MSMLRRGATLLALLLMAGATATAQKNPEPNTFSTLELQAARSDPKAYTLDESSVRIQNLGPAVDIKQIGIPERTGKNGRKDEKPGTPEGEPGGIPGGTPEPVPGGEGADPFVIIDQIINLGERIWGIIEKNKPVVNIQTQYGTATPKGVDHWTQLAGWKPPKGTIYGFLAKNTYGATVVNVRYQVLRTYGGNYNGKGKYLTAVSIEPLNVDVLWGYKFDLTVEIPDSSIVNAGTSEDPVAAMQPIVKWRIATAIKSSDGRCMYYLKGDGFFQEVAGAFSAKYQDGVAKAVANAVEYKF